MHRNALWLSTAALTAALSAFQVGAEPGALPAATSYGAVMMISGGADSDEAALFKQAAARYPLRVVFSVRGGEYAVPDQFTLLRKGTVMAQMPPAGPWLLIDVPPGRYVLQARIDDRVVERAVNVSRTGSTVQWVLPSPPT